MIPRNKLSTFALLAAINLLLIGFVVAGVELAFGDWRVPYVPPLGSIVNRTYVYHQNLYEPESDIVYSRDKYGLRGVQEPLSQVELVTVGGSTTDQRYITDTQTWQQILRARLGIAVANAGVDGMTSFGHIIAMTEWLHDLPGFSPKYYLHYIGVNDASISANGDVRYLDLSGRDSPWLLYIRKRSVIAKAAEKIWFGATGPRPVSHGAVQIDPTSTAMIKASADEDKIKNFIDEVYIPNLRKLIALHRAYNAVAILVSQGGNPAMVRWDGDDTFVAAQLPALQQWAVTLKAINAATRSVCLEAADVCRFSDASRVTFEPGDFYDLVHQTPSGARKLGEFLAQDLLAQNPAISRRAVPVQPPG